ncbi:hypothetical protein ACFWVC_19335 [Streptomyces sp. NPDC058691]
MELILILVVLVGVAVVFGVVLLARGKQRPGAAAQRHNPAAWQERQD